MITVTGQDFVVVEQRAGTYTPHVFASREQFQTWMQARRPRNIRARTSARGQCQAAVDHRGESHFDPDQAWLDYQLSRAEGPAGYDFDPGL